MKNSKKKILITALGLFALTSCSSLSGNKASGSSQGVGISSSSNEGEKVDIKVIRGHYNVSSDVRDLVRTIQGKTPDSLRDFNRKNFEVSNLKYLYKGEEIYTNKKLSDHVSVVKFYADHPVFYFKKGSKLYEENKVAKPGVTEVEKVTLSDKNDNIVEGIKVKVLNENYLYALIKDDRNQSNKPILLPYKVEIKERPNLEDKFNNKTRYKDLNSDSDFGRVKYSINTVDQRYDYDDTDGFDEALNTNVGDDSSSVNGGIDYSFVADKKKYEDVDDYAGIHRVIVRQHINGSKDVFLPKNIDFGSKISDFKDDFSKLLSNLDTAKRGLRFNDDYTTIDGGFDKYEVNKILKYYKEEARAKEGNDFDPEKYDSRVKFVTELANPKEKGIVGEHDIVRKIIVDGKVVFEKHDYAFVGFPGTTVGVADGTFFDLPEYIEKRTLRNSDKAYDNVEDFLKDADTVDDKRKALQGLERVHGNVVIGSMIDEIATKDNFYWFTQLDNILVNMGISDKNLPDWVKGYKGLNEMIGNVILVTQTRYGDLPIHEYLDPLLIDATDKLDDVTKWIVDNRIDDGMPDKTQSEKIEILKTLKEKYKTLRTALHPIIFAPENVKIKYTDLHWETLTGGANGHHISPTLIAKNLSAMLDRDKNVKVVNMSYGSMYNVEEYTKLAAMTDADFEKGAKAYNTDTFFREAVLAWLRFEKIRTESVYDSNEDGSLNIPSVYDYFITRGNNISKGDYKKLVNLKLITLKDLLSHAPELTASNHDVLLIRSEGNTYESGAPVNLTDYDKDGKKIAYIDPDRKYSNSFLGIPTYLNEVAKEKAEKEGKEFKYNYSYRKNIVGSIGLAPTLINAGSLSTEKYNDSWGLNTSNFGYKRFRLFGVGMLQEYNHLVDKLNDAEMHPEKYSAKDIAEIKAKIKEIDDFSKKHADLNDVTSKFSFSRAGKAMLWSMAADGGYVFTKKLNDEEKKYNKVDKNHPESSREGYDYASNEDDFGSSFSAPRMTAVAGEVGTLFPWMTAHDIKTTLLTTAIDDVYVVEEKDNSSVDAKDIEGHNGSAISEENKKKAADKAKEEADKEKEKNKDKDKDKGNDDNNEFNKQIEDDLKLVDDDKKDDDSKENKDKNVKHIVKGLYGVDENIGWGILDKDAAYKGPARFVKALTHEVGEENFIADIPYGSYIFGNNIEGGFDPILHMASRHFINEDEAKIIYATAKFSIAELKDPKFLDNNEKLKPLFHDKYTIDYLVDTLRPRIAKYIPSLPFEERELFYSAGLEKRGKGTLILDGLNTYSAPTLVEDGTLIIRGSNLSDVTVSKGAKLKLDTIVAPLKNASRIINGLKPVQPGVLGTVTNSGKLYSYAPTDYIEKYVPKEGSETNIAAFAKLTLNHVDFSDLSEFDVNIFGKKGMKLFDFITPTPVNETDLSKDALDKISDTHKNEKNVLEIKNISKENFDKIKHLKKDLSLALEFVIKPITDKDGKVTLGGFIERKDGYKIDDDYNRDFNAEDEEAKKKKDDEDLEKIRENFPYEDNENDGSEESSDDSGSSEDSENPDDNENQGDSVSSENAENAENAENGEEEPLSIYTELRSSVVEAYKEGKITALEANAKLNTLDWFNNEDADSLSGDILADSTLLGFDIANTRLHLLNSKFDTRSDKPINFFLNALDDIRIRKVRGKEIISNIAGTIFGANYKTKYDTFGIALDYTHSKLKDVKLQEVNKPIVPSTDNPNPQQNSGIRRTLGNMDVDSYGISLTNKAEYKGAYLSSVFSVGYIHKEISKDTPNKDQLVDIRGNDFLINMYNELGYSYGHRFNDMFKLTTTPFAGINYVNYSKDAYDTNEEFGYKGEVQKYNKASLVLGAKFRLDVSDVASISIFGDYNKYLTNTDLDTKAEIDEYYFTRTIKGVKLQDNSVNFGISAYYKPLRNLGFSLGYANKDIKTNSVNAGIRFEF